MNEQIEELLQNNTRWKYLDDSLVGEWKLDDFESLREVVHRLCDLAADLDHHPKVSYGYNTLRVETTTHDAGNKVTEKDIELAKRVSELVGE